jgi:hypothetical protein
MVDVVVPLTDPPVTSWSAGNAAQVIGMQWQFTGEKVDPDAGSGCPIEIAVSNIRFVP